ncbi:hypothetical protein B5C34_08950 [Pacificimonas flava]|uniref:histidine kinase n=2 Tax=Pacificimonas TaxID=1960290 RepID=A0A219B634_9SPHN|nr:MULTISPECIES: histidine kinase dimerization/phospho-acceptor domain-containing protein [Pacificimonas]MBZ6379205.1 hypothetical protein [Pacificimonas aurantium]OWV33576.1 hypothetical protein B5C34_08950 [Pacificimonas flava]
METRTNDRIAPLALRSSLSRQVGTFNLTRLRSRLESVSPLVLLLWAIGAVAALLASCERIVIAPGMELYLAPFFYFLVYRWFGFRWGVLAAFVFSLPSLMWWGHWFTIGLSVGNVVFLGLLRNRIQSLALKTFVYYLTVGALASYLFLTLHYDAPGIVIQVSMLRKLLTDVMLAALADAVTLALARNWRTGKLQLRRFIYLQEVLPASVLFVAMLGGLAVLLSGVRDFPAAFESEQRHVYHEIAIQALRGNLQPGPTPIYWPLHDNGSEVAVSTSLDALREPEVLSRLGCDFLDRDRADGGANDRNTFAYWLRACIAQNDTSNGVDYAFLYPTSSIYQGLFANLLEKFRLPAMAVGLLILLVISLQRLLRSSLDVWTDVVSNFANPDLKRPKGFTFAEFRIPIGQFVEENNRHASLLAERQRLVTEVRDLQKNINLQLLTEIAFDPRRGLLVYQRINLEGPTAPSRMRVHPNDLNSLEAREGDENIYVEFRDADDPDTWYLLIAREGRGNYWMTGCLFEMRQHKLGRETQMQQARLMELGGMASALSHELKQPLFTISLSAENAEFILEDEDSPRVAKAKVKLDQIAEQVKRARSIIDRISRYARVDSAREEVVDLEDTVNSAAGFMRPLLVQKNVRLQVALSSTCWMIMSKV